MSSTTHPQHHVHLGPRGRLVLPAPVRRHLGLQDGDCLVLSIEDHAVRLVSARHIARTTRGFLRTFLGEAARESLVEDLLRQRRAEAQQDG
jgi:AbrB family looped-hinge helix DNA binding protein